jgi:hypothetical protein
MRRPTRARGLGVFRLWRDFGFVLGAPVAGIGTDAASRATRPLGRSGLSRRER